MMPPKAPKLSSLRAGAGVVDITPEGAVFLYGYPHVPRLSTGVNDPLECAALFIEGGGGEGALFIANDLIFVSRELVNGVRRRIARATGIAEHAIMITATHTHSGPVTVNYLSNAADPVVPKADDVYLAWLSDRMVEAATAAVRSAIPAEVGLAVAEAAHVGTNRHNPLGPADPQVPIFVARSLQDERPIGCMVVYGMHPTVLHEDSTLISADFPFYFRKFLQHSVLPESCPVIYHNGASGNQSPRHVTRSNTFAEARRIGEILGQSVADSIRSISYLRDLQIEARSTTVELALRIFPSLEIAEKEAGAALAQFERLKLEGASRQTLRTAECDVFGAEEVKELARASFDGRLRQAAKNSLPAEIQLIVLGPWNLVGWPGEFFVEYGLALKALSPSTFLVTMANGELQGYIVTAEAAALGVYEASNAVFAPESGERFVKATLALINAPK